MALFDRYLMVDWSGASVPRLGRDSIWTCLIEARRRPRLENHPTREEATAAIRAIMRESVAAGRRLLAGFDFSFAYPAGFAARLGLDGAPWLAVWRLLAREIVDGEDNQNNRFAVAAELNRRLGGEAFPFWGCPARQQRATLAMRGRRPHGPGDIAERRLAERVLKRVQPSWKLHYTGSVGGQTLVGIPRLHALRFDPELQAITRVWPFETGFVPLTRRHLDPVAVLVTEIYPSLIPLPDGAAVKDARQVEAMARFLLQHDRKGDLGALFAAPVDGSARTVIEREEGWIFGAGAYVRRTHSPSPPRGEGRGEGAAKRETARRRSSNPRPLTPTLSPVGRGRVLDR